MVNKCYGSALGKTIGYHRKDSCGHMGLGSFGKCIKSNLDMCFQGRVCEEPGWTSLPSDIVTVRLFIRHKAR